MDPTNDTKAVSAPSSIAPSDEKSHDEKSRDEKVHDEGLLWKTAIDPYGRRSMAVQRSNGSITTWTEMWERSAPGPDPRDEGCRHVMRKLDELMCWMLFEDWKSARVRSVLQAVCLPVFLLRLGWFMLRLQVDSWMGRHPGRDVGSA